MRHFLNDIEITPRNRTDIGVQSDFTGDPQVLQLSVDSVVLPREAFDLVMSHLTATGLFEGMPYRVELDSGVVLQYYVDFLDGFIVQQHEVEVKIKRRKGYDDFFQKAEGTSFELMLAEGVVFDNFKVPYFVIPPNFVESAIPLIICGYVMTKELIDAGKAVGESIVELIQALTPNLGFPSIDWGDVIALALKAIARIIIFALILVAVLEMATQMFNLLFQPKRNFQAVKFKELLTKGCAYLGYQFESTIFDTQPNWTLLPVPLTRGRQSLWDVRPESWIFPFNKGVPSASDTTPTLGQFIEGCKTMFNAEIKVNNGVVRMERWDYWSALVSAQLFPALNLQSERDEKYSFNTSDVWKRYYIKYQIDYNDLFTMDGEMYDNHDCEFSTEPLNVINQDLVSIKGLNQADIPFALGARKSKLNWIELIAKVTFFIVDAVTGAFGGGSNFASTIGERKDCLKISQQYFGVTKALYTVSGKQQANYFDVVSAKNLWENYHYINQIQLNGWLIKEDARIRITSQEFVTLLENNFAIIDGEIAEILNIKYIDERANSLISYRTRNSYAVGKVTTKLING